jgi:hypothetical protein
MNEPNSLVRGLFISLDVGPYLWPIWGPLGFFLGVYGSARMAPKWREKKKQHKNLFSGCFGQFLLKEYA